MTFRALAALPVYNEVRHVDDVLDAVTRYCPDVLVVDDGSSDGTGALLEARNDIFLVTHSRNRGYGAALTSAFAFAVRGGYDCLVTLDCDGQHQPRRIPQFIGACRRTGADLVSGSRYLRHFAGDDRPPADRCRINQEITAVLNERLGLDLTDGFCGFKAYRVAALERLAITEAGYAMPLELWVQAVAVGLKIVELPVPLIYLEEARSFGGELDDAATRLRHYYDVLDRSIAAAEAAGWRPRQHAPASPCPV
jgi:dolichol-phosphate mannosyltransferase